MHLLITPPVFRILLFLDLAYQARHSPVKLKKPLIFYLCAMHTTEADKNYLQQSTIPLHNSFYDTRLEKRTTEIVTSHTEGDQSPDSTVSRKLQKKDHPPIYIPGNEYFSYRPILELEQLIPQVPSVADSHHNTCEISNPLPNNQNHDGAYARPEKRKASRKAYEQSEKGKATRKTYRESERAKASQKTYEESEKGKATRKTYRESERGKATQKAYRESDKGKMKRAIINARFIAYKSALKKGFSEEAARQKGELAANAKRAKLLSASSSPLISHLAEGILTVPIQPASP